MEKNTIYNLISHKAIEWLTIEKESPQSIVGNLFQTIEKQNRLRIPQKEAIRNYLWIKFVGRNQKLSTIVRQGLLYDAEIVNSYEYSHIFQNNSTKQFLNQFFVDNSLENLAKDLRSKGGEETKWEDFLNELLHNFSYSNYLYSLPMGAGKTFLMACFIYLDLYLASIFGKKDERFAHNFVVLAPHASKTAILPSLKTIKNFDPHWILPETAAKKTKQLIKIEVLDSLSSQRKDKLQGNNPNLEKVNRLTQSENFGLVFITNAEKVVLEKYNADNKKQQQNFLKLPQKNEAEYKNSNELREALSKIPQLGVILDEVHHSYSSNGNAEKKLRQAVDILNQHQNINSVIGLSGTPYVKTNLTINEQKIRLNQIQDTVYNYPLNLGIGNFLKIPKIKSKDTADKDFVHQALSDFFENYDFAYTNGTKSKIAFYCPTIEKLNQNFLPIIKEWYQKNRPQKEAEIFCYYTDNKNYKLPKENLAIFHNLDQPHSLKRVVLLVAVGKEGWDCKSLASVVLPRRETTKIFVLQACCRCLREVEDAKKEKALIYLSPDNYQTLEQELKNNYRLTINDIQVKQENTIQAQIRKPQLGTLKYKQIRATYEIICKKEANPTKDLKSFSMQEIKERFSTDYHTKTAEIGKDGLVKEKISEKKKENFTENFDFSWIDFIYKLAKSLYWQNELNEANLSRLYEKELKPIYKEITSEMEWIKKHPILKLSDIISDVAGYFLNEVRYQKNEITEETEIQLLEWNITPAFIPFYSTAGAPHILMPEIEKQDFEGRHGYKNYPEHMEKDFFNNDNNADPQDISYNYIPYKLDSNFEKNALTEMLKYEALETYEVYYNGYKNKNLQSFWIQTPRGKYTPDFLILKRKECKKYQKSTKNKKNAENAEIEKVLILETKGSIYYTDNDFRAKENFVKKTFLSHNKKFQYHCFVDEENKNDFKKHRDRLLEILKNF